MRDEKELVRTLVSASFALFVLGLAANARADVQLNEDDEVERPDAAAMLGDSAPGAIIDRSATRPSWGKDDARACSWRSPICVHFTHKTAPALALSALDSAERAWSLYVDVMNLPAPDTSIMTGAYDLYLVDGVPGDVITMMDERDTRSRVDRANAFTLLDARLTKGCAQDAAIAYGMARAIQMRAAPAVDEGSARAEAQSLASLVVPCAMGRLAGDTSFFQMHADRTFADAWVASDERVGVTFDRGASLFYTWLDETYGQYPGAMVNSIWALAPTITAPLAPRWNDEPDGFDVLRKSFKGAFATGSTVDDLWLDFAVARAFMGSRGDGKHGLETRTLGDAGAVHFDWEIDFPDHARSLASLRPLSPLGSAYFSIRTKDAPEGARLRVEASWEEHAMMKLALVRIDATGAEMGRLVVGAPKRATNAQMSLVDLHGVDHVLVVAVNTGDTAYGFDPDDAEWEPHAIVVSVGRE